MCAQVTLTKTGLSAVWTFNPLGVKDFNLGMILHKGHHKWDPIFFKIIKYSQPMKNLRERMEIEP
jgi:hypothetical protein